MAAIKDQDWTDDRWSEEVQVLQTYIGDNRSAFSPQALRIVESAIEAGTHRPGTGLLKIGKRI